MRVEFSWHIPCGGDGRWMSQRQPERAPRVRYLTQIARAAELVGFDSVLVPAAFTNGNHGLDAAYLESYTLGVACLAATQHIRVIIAHRPGFVHPGLFAQMCSTADDLAEGRLALNIVTGTPGDLGPFGDQLDHDARYERAEEYLTILRRLWAAPRTTFDGEFYQLRDARLFPKPIQPGGPPLYLVGSSDMGIGMAARHADIYMMSLDTVGEVERRVREIRKRAATFGRTPRFCVAATVFAAQTDRAARVWADSFAEHADLAVVADRASAGRATSSTDDRRARENTDLHSWLTPHLWRGIAHLTHGTALVGSYTALADTIAEYVAAGVTNFQFYGYPYLEQAYNVGEHLLPQARDRITELPSH